MVVLCCGSRKCSEFNLGSKNRTSLTSKKFSNSHSVRVFQIMDLFIKQILHTNIILQKNTQTSKLAPLMPKRTSTFQFVEAPFSDVETSTGRSKYILVYFGNLLKF